MSIPLQRVCVFAGSNIGADAIYLEAAQSLGSCLGARGRHLIYGGARIGLMGGVADAVLRAGGRVTGVIPEALVAKEVAHRGPTELQIVVSMHERKAAMAESADAFIALPGGFGTLDELFEILTWAQLGLHQKPCGLLNTGRYFEGLLSFVDHSVQQGFVRSEHRAMLAVADTPEALLDQMEAYEPTSVTKWDRTEEKNRSS